MEDQNLQAKQYNYRKGLRLQKCPNCEAFMGDLPGSRDAYCPECGYKDPCCE